MGETIPELNQKLQQLRKSFTRSSQILLKNVKITTQRFTPQDRAQFDQLLIEIREYANSKILNFINQKITSKTDSFTSHFTTFNAETAQLYRSGVELSEYMESSARELKAEENYKEEQIEKVIDKYATIEQYKKVMRAFKSNMEHRRKRNNLEAKALKMYKQKMMQKCFFPWRAFTYKDGHENQVKRHTQVHLRKVHSQFGSVVDVLKAKILQTEEMIRIKKVAKGEFAYALSKNLLKTISNLSLEVMSLNQIATKDKQNEDQTNQFLNEVNNLISTKMESKRFVYSGVISHKETLLSTEFGFSRKEQFQKSKQLPSQLSTQSVPKRKKISFA